MAYTVNHLFIKSKKITIGSKIQQSAHIKCRCLSQCNQMWSNIHDRNIHLKHFLLHMFKCNRSENKFSKRPHAIVFSNKEVECVIEHCLVLVMASLLL